jgi:TonB family protein
MGAETSVAAVAAGEAAPGLIRAAEGGELRPSHIAYAWTALNRDERQFYIGLACAVVLHTLLLIGVIGFATVSPDEVRKRIGDKGGELEGVSIEMVTEADFRNRETVPLDGGQPPAQPSAARQPTQAAKPTPPQQQPAERTPEQQQPPQKAEPQPKPVQQKQTATALAKETPDLLTMPDLTGKPQPREQPSEKQEQKSQPQQQHPPQPRQPETKQQQQQQARLPDLSAPPSRPGENYASFSRPAGITRSGENDDFARGVIRALRKTMPPGRGLLGRVTIRFLLTDNGNLQEVQLVNTTGNGALTQDVVFSSRQAYFPFPPRGATVADRTFLVTYIYE